jgi:hypothetical protein
MAAPRSSRGDTLKLWRSPTLVLSVVLVSTASLIFWAGRNHSWRVTIKSAAANGPSSKSSGGKVATNHFPPSQNCQSQYKLQRKSNDQCATLHHSQGTKLTALVPGCGKAGKFAARTRTIACRATPRAPPRGRKPRSCRDHIAPRGLVRLETCCSVGSSASLARASCCDKVTGSWFHTKSGRAG